MAKRTRIDIIADILSIVQEKRRIKQTHLMYKANMAHKQMGPYLEELVEKELIKKVNVNNYPYLIITDKGCEFVSKLKMMKEFQKAFGL